MTNVYIIFIITPLFILRFIPNSLFIMSSDALSLIILKSIYGKNVYWKKFNSSPNNIWAIIDEKAIINIDIPTDIDVFLNIVDINNIRLDNTKREDDSLMNRIMNSLSIFFNIIK